MADEDVYEAECIVDMRSKKGRTEYKVRWKGYSADDDTWEPVKNIIDTQLVCDFESRQRVAGREVRHFEAVRMSKGAWQYLVHWVGSHEPSWEPVGTFPLAESTHAQAFWRERGEEPPAAAVGAAPRAVADSASRAAADQAAAERAAAEVERAAAVAQEKAKQEEEQRERAAAAAQRAAQEEKAAAEKERAAKQAEERRAAEAQAARERAAAQQAAQQRAAAQRAAARAAAEEQEAAAARDAARREAEAATPAERAALPAPAAPAAPASAPGPMAVDGEPWVSRLPAQWRVGAILGETASGKSLAIRELRAAGLVSPERAHPQPWPTDQAIVSAIADSRMVRDALGSGSGSSSPPPPAGHVVHSTPQQAAAAAVGEDETRRAELAMTRLGSVGLNSLPVWLRPYAALSNGQRMRTDVARDLESGLALDDFGSTVDARNASVCAAGIARSVRLRGLERVVVASVHAEVLPWLGADWAYFTATGSLVLSPNPGARPSVTVRYDTTTNDAAFAKDLLSHPTAPGTTPGGTSSGTAASSSSSSSAGAAPYAAVAASDAVLERAQRTIMPSSSAVFFGQVKRNVLQSTVALDAAVRAAASAFEYNFDGTSSFTEPSIPPIKASWRVGLLLGKSGSGKSTCLARLLADHRADSRSGRPPPRNSASFGGEGEPPAEGVWPADAPAATMLEPSALEFLRRGGSGGGGGGGGGRALAAVAEAAARRPFAQLSRGERTVLALVRLCTAPRDDAARDGAASHAPPPPSLSVADEFTSFVDRPTAAAAAAATRALWLRRGGSERLVCASVHGDVLSSLKPDWAFDTEARKLTLYTWDAADLADDQLGRAPLPQGAADAAAAFERAKAASAQQLFAPPAVDIVVRQTSADIAVEEAAAANPGAKARQQRSDERSAIKRRMWDLFKAHHYMTSELSPQSLCSVARWGSVPVGFVATLPKPGRLKAGDGRQLHREHRLVVLPDYQGLGIGLRLSEAVGSLMLSKGLRYSSRTAHFVLRNARARSPRWQQVLSAGQKEGQGSVASGMGNFGGTKPGAGKGGGGKAGGGESDGGDDGGDDAGRMLFTHEFIGDEQQQRASHLVAIERAAAAAAGSAASPHPGSGRGGGGTPANKSGGKKRMHGSG